MINITDQTQSHKATQNVWETPAENRKHPDRAKEAENKEKAKKAEMTERAQSGEKGTGFPQKGEPPAPDLDRYVHEEKEASPGIYQTARDEDGNRRIVFDDPDQKAKESPEAKGEEEPPEGAKAPEKGEEKEQTCTVNTDMVDREIEKLKQETEELEKKAAKAHTPEEKKEMEGKLRQAESELRMKDTDSYRRQHAQYTYS